MVAEKKKHHNKAHTLIMIMIIVVLVYTIVMFELYKHQVGIFKPYKRPTPPGAHFFPLGTVTPLTPDELATKNQVITNSVNQAS